MSKVEIELNREGVRQLMRSPEMQAILKAQAEAIKDKCGEGYETYTAPTRAVAIVGTATADAIRDNSDNNTILNAVGASRNGAVVHEHYRHLKDGRVIKVKSYQRKK